MRLENWSVTYGEISPYQAPETLRPKLQGIVFGNPNFDDGEYVVTSSIMEVIDGVVITRSGSSYELGDVNPEYEARYPDALNRLSV